MERVSGDRLAQLVRDAREHWRIPGIAVGLWYDGEVTTVVGGVRELGRDAAVTPATVFRVASITKPVVAALALTLVQEGLLDLDEPPPGTQTSATTRQLLSHQGGLAQEWPEQLDPFDESDEALLRVAAERPKSLGIAPGELFSYCNVGYWLVGAAIARATGTTFEEAMRARILDPLGLTATGFEPQAEHARGHQQIRPGSGEHDAAVERYPRARRPSGGLWSSVGDLLAFAQHQLGGGGPLTAETIAEMQRPQIEVGSHAYGLGWFLGDRDGGGPLIEHSGSAAGYESVLLLVPDERIAFAALTNSSRGAAAIRDLREALDLLPRQLPALPLPATAVARFAGRYSGPGLELEFVADDGRLRVELTELDPFTGKTSTHPRVLAHPIGEREFEIESGEWRGERFDFPRDGVVCIGALAFRVE